MRSGIMISRMMLIAALMIPASGAVGQAEDWRRLGQDGPFEIAVDVGSFTGPTTQRAIRTMMVALEEDAPVAYMVLNVRIDCDARTISAVDGIAYDAGGSELGGGPLDPDTTPVDEADGTNRLARAACDGLEIDGRRFESVRAFAAWAAVQPIEP